MATNIFYDNILEPIQEQLSTVANIATEIDVFPGSSEGIRLMPISAEVIGESHASVNYSYTVLVSYKTNETLDSQAKTQILSDIKDTLNRTRVNVSSLLFYDGRVQDIDLFPEPEIDDEGVVLNQANINITFSASTQELF